MFNIGPTELVVILVIALIVFGPKRLPEVGRTVGKSLREFRRASEELKEGLDLGLDEQPTVGSMPPGEPTWETSDAGAGSGSGPGAGSRAEAAADPAGRSGEAGGGRAG